MQNLLNFTLCTLCQRSFFASLLSPEAGLLFHAGIASNLTPIKVCITSLVEHFRSLACAYVKSTYTYTKSAEPVLFTCPAVQRPSHCLYLSVQATQSLRLKVYSTPIAIGGLYTHVSIYRCIALNRYS